tara:strand:+ start:2330 stop:2683 length:354 start_codon:yes stop_codon:yes gene_type:complete
MHHLTKGYLGERLAELYLRYQGLEMVARNYRCRYGEVDLIMRDGDACVFIEVKSRLHDAFNHEQHHIDLRKQQKIILTSTIFMNNHPRFFDLDIRYDAMIVQLSNLRLVWLDNAFTP